MGEDLAARLDAVQLNFSSSSMHLLNVILAVVMFSIALELKPSDFKRIVQAPRALVTGLVSQFVLLPFLTFCLVLIAQPQPSIALGMMLVAACPGGNISNFISHRAGGNAALSVSLTAFSTVAAIVLTPANIAFWGSFYRPTREILRKTAIDPLSVVLTVGLLLVLPLCLGMLLCARRPELTARIVGPMKLLSMGIFILFVALALAANWAFFLQYAALVAALVLAHNAMALGVGYLAARLAGLSEFDRRAVTIETGIQNSGLGLILIFGFFDGLGGMAVVAAFWGVWHIISGITLASVMARKPAKGFARRA